MQETVIAFKDFSFTYKAQQKPTIKHLDLEIRKGEKVLIVGPSGSGKSTLGNCINALIPNAYPGKMEGSVIVASLDIENSDIYEVNKRVGTVLQDTDGQFVGLSVAEDIAFSLENQCRPQQEMIPLVEQMANVVGMKALLSKSPQEISGGQKQRVSLAGVLVDDVDILLFDEPLANLDPATGKLAISLIDELHVKTGKTIIIIEHRLEDVLSCPVDRILLIEDGALVADKRPEELLKGSLLSENGIRDPLYLAAMRHSGCDLSLAKNIASVDSIGLEPFKDQILKWYHLSPEIKADIQGPELMRLEDVSFSYDGLVPVLQHITFSLKQGEMVSILGKNGAGKSTLAQILTGINSADQGKIFFENRCIDTDTVTERSPFIGYVMQNPNHMISHSMIFDEVAFALRQKGYEEEEIQERVMDVLELCNLQQYHAWPIAALSYGQKKRVTIASILVMNPKILILDEPTAGQDYLRYTALMEFLCTLNKQTGLTILFITHDMHLALEYTSRSLVLCDGHLLADEKVSEVFSDRELLQKANLTVTSLYTLAQRCCIEDVSSFIDCFIRSEQKNRPQGKILRILRTLPDPSVPKKKKIKAKKPLKEAKSGKKFGFGLHYEPTDSWIHRLNGVTKLLFFMGWVVLCLTTFDIRILLPSVILAQIGLATCKVPMRKFRPFIFAICYVILINALFIFLFSPDQGRIYLGTRTIILGPVTARYALSLETLFYLLVVCLKYFAIFPVALLFVTCTHPSHFSSSLNRIGVRYRTAYAVGLAMRYLPEVTASYVHILHAQMARGVDISKNVSLRKRIGSVSKILAPLVLSSLDRIDVVTNAMVLRGFGKNKKRTWFLSTSLKPADLLVLVVFSLWLAFSLYERFVKGIMFWYPT
ncbi:DUF3744 domain-containing protein [uncultured Sphaerochaeta sp.]|uniref:DUF3744 domain-containing protein n=1 Tax=uncultured Sphaerochaeta sp. TaxID=886478 RepID=UPI002A0A962D|nr:DUF3744 domain-containing protein [uncultured Sphaerochaeta sp.]